MSPRPPRPSTPEAQMAALLRVARKNAGASRGRCLEALRANILEAGGYGDLLDLLEDERLHDEHGRPAWRYHAAALGLARAVEDLGPATLGLEALDISPVDAPPGSILVTRGTGRPGCPIDPRVGDVSVVDGLQGGTLERPLRRLADGRCVWVLDTAAEPGAPIRCRVALASGPTDRGPPGEELGWLPREALAELPVGLLVHADGSALLPADRDRWRAPAFAGSVVAIYRPLARPVHR